MKRKKDLSTNKPSFKKIIFPCIFFLAVGGLILFSAVKDLIHANASNSWPSAEGTVSSSKVVSQLRDGTRTYYAILKYEYCVNGEYYTGNKVAFGTNGSGKLAHARELVQKYSKNSYVDVFYKPSNPNESILETGIKARAFIGLGIGLFFFLAGLLMTIYLPRIINRKKKTPSH